jgi:hypothetical protein
LETLLKHSLLLTGIGDEPIPFETLLKHSLLITHGTVYGEIFAELFYISPDITDNILVIGDAAEPGDVDFPFILGPVISLITSSSITHNEPVDIVHWDAGPGKEASSGMLPWEQCAVVLTRL